MLYKVFTLLKSINFHYLFKELIKRYSFVLSKHVSLMPVTTDHSANNQM